MYHDYMPYVCLVKLYCAVLRTLILISRRLVGPNDNDVPTLYNNSMDSLSIKTLLLCWLPSRSGSGDADCKPTSPGGAIACSTPQYAAWHVCAV